jgi:hypothetical protein
MTCSPKLGKWIKDNNEEKKEGRNRGIDNMERERESIGEKF